MLNAIHVTAWIECVLIQRVNSKYISHNNNKIVTFDNSQKNGL